MSRTDNRLSEANPDTHALLKKEERDLTSIKEHLEKLVEENEILGVSLAGSISSLKDTISRIKRLL